MKQSTKLYMVAWIYAILSLICVINIIYIQDNHILSNPFALKNIIVNTIVLYITAFIGGEFTREYTFQKDKETKHPHCACGEKIIHKGTYHGCKKMYEEHHP